MQSYFNDDDIARISAKMVVMVTVNVARIRIAVTVSTDLMEKRNGLELIVLFEHVRSELFISYLIWW